MRLLVMFDLPTSTKAERKASTRFRKFLLEDGYVMEQFSVYSRVSLSRDNLETHLERLRANLPKSGRVVAISLTEKQYEDREVLVCSADYEGSFIDLGTQMTLTF